MPYNFQFNFAECGSYQTFDSDDRDVSSSNENLCDSGLDPKWYRFEDEDGSYLPESCPEPQSDVCGTGHPGWLNGIHPTVSEGVVTRTVCFSHTSGCCQYTTTIQIKNCGNFYVYYLEPAPLCDLGYCVTNVGEYS